VIAIAVETMREVARRRFILVALIATVAVALLTGWGFSHLHHVRHGDKPISALEMKAISAVLLILIAYAFSFVLAFASALVAAPMLSSEVESGVLLPVLARALPRWKVVAGKAAGLAIVLCAYAILAGALECAVILSTTGYLPPHPLAAGAALSGLVLVVLAFTLATAARLPAIASSVVAVMCFGAAWMAGIVASFYPVYHNETLLRIGTISQLLLPTDAMWRIAVYNLEPAIMQIASPGAGWKGPFWVTAPPPPAMEIWCALWIAGAVALAAWSFSTRDV
jgi:ABC-type transport system involved in multi-copper enzyme maturation permease subunit